MKHHELAIMNRLISAAFLPALLFICADGQQKQPGKNEGNAKEAKAPMLKHEYAAVNGHRLHYVTAGKGKLIIFLHGFPEFWYEWKNQLAEFGRDYQAVAPDMRGYNLSSKPAEVEQYQVKYLVEDLRALAEKLGDRKSTRLNSSHDQISYAVFCLKKKKKKEKKKTTRSKSTKINAKTHTQ